jgi:hypothetical protein
MVIGRYRMLWTVLYRQDFWWRMWCRAVHIPSRAGNFLASWSSWTSRCMSNGRSLAVAWQMIDLVLWWSNTLFWWWLCSAWTDWGGMNCSSMEGPDYCKCTTAQSGLGCQKFDAQMPCSIWSMYVCCRRSNKSSSLQSLTQVLSTDIVHLFPQIKTLPTKRISIVLQINWGRSRRALYRIWRISKSVIKFAAICSSRDKGLSLIDRWGIVSRCEGIKGAHPWLRVIWFNMRSGRSIVHRLCRFWSLRLIVCRGR